jgi:hypothetical protein
MFYRVSIYIACLICSLSLRAQFDPPAGQPGSRAIHADSNVFIDWVKDVVVKRGWVEAGNESLGNASYGQKSDILGKADLSAVSLGDGGTATLSFNFPIWNGPGPDFAVFENSFSDSFLELAFVEVSSDGEYFVRFPAQSLTQTDVQIESFGSLEAAKLHNLAGKYRGMYGVPFDLDELRNQPDIDVQSITHIRIIDVIGSLDPLLGSFDDEGRLINDPYPTPFPTSGFDLDAVGVIYDTRNLLVPEQNKSAIRCFPQPASDVLYVEFTAPAIIESINVYDLQGKLIYKSNLLVEGKLSLESFPAGSFIVEVSTIDTKIRQVFMKR